MKLFVNSLFVCAAFASAAMQAEESADSRPLFLRLLKSGDIVSLSASTDKYSLTIVTPEQKRRSQTEYEMASRLRTVQTRTEAGRRDKLDALMRDPTVDPAERQRLIDQLRSSSRSSSFSTRRLSFYDVIEIGDDYVGLSKEDRELFLPLHTIRTISRVRQVESKTGTAQWQLNVLSTALRTYYLEVGEFPSSKHGFQALVSRPMDAKNLDKWNGPYLKDKVPSDPWGKSFHYQRNEGGFGRVWSTGADGKSTDLTIDVRP
jgi:type II secretion system protein G